MLRSNVNKAISAIVVLVIAIIAFLPMQRGQSNRSQWMSELDDDRGVNTLFIPGTHDSGATHSIADLSGKCQSLSIKEQLKLGVRFFDLRLQLKNNRLVVVHSFVDQATDFEDVLSCMIDFLKENPSEFLLVSFKEDNDPSGSDIDFTDKLEEMLKAESLVSRETDLPATVGEARGKLHVISRYKNSSIGIPAYEGWRDSTSFELGKMYIQDHYQVDSAEEKISDIKSAFQVASGLEYGLVLNFTSCYYPNGFPPTYAGTPAREINRWLSDTLNGGEAVGCVFVCDFITRELSDAVIGRNFE
ncbi:MAG: phosphatidylinositol-specific phospholipase C domain-containing protein [Clostridia bacterium]|nr:phosphatidylinositol-specific phospholipase C domain-containing protein [Clostridia bacterium]